MSKNDADDKRVACEILEAAGLQVDHVPESTTLRCDLRASSGEDDKYLFEVKGFHDADAIAAALRTGKDYEQALHFDSARAVQAGIHNAMKQLESTAIEGADELRFLALLVRSEFDPDVRFQQILGHLYGKRSLVVASRTPGRADQFECIFFSHSAFFRYQDCLDGAVVLNGGDAILFINDYGKHLQKVRQSALCRFFATHEAMHDVAGFERKGFLVADCAIDRKDEESVRQYVAQKYSLTNPRLMAFQRHSAFAGVR